MRVSQRFSFLLSLTLIAVLFAASAAMAQVPQTQINDAPVERAAPESFVIFPWDILPADAKAYETVKECGFNLAGFVDPKNLDLVQSAGMKAFVSGTPLNLRGTNELSDEEIAKRVESLTASTKNHPAVFGYHVIDEPPRPQVPLIRKVADAIQNAAPDRIAYTNFLPIFGGKSIEERKSVYENYLNTYLEGGKFKAFSYDNYAVMDDGSVRENFFPNLEVARNVSQKSGVPFWFVGLANAHFHYAEPSPGTFRFQAFSALAYGARGMGWFTYSGRDRGNYRLTAIDLAGQRTATWHMLQDVNLQLHRLAPTYTTLKSINVFHHPADKVPAGCSGIDTSKWLKDVKGEGPFCVGEFERPDGTGAVLVVNRNVQKSAQFSIVPKEKAQIIRVSSYTGKSRPWAAEDNWLPPGDGVLLLLDPSK